MEKLFDNLPSQNHMKLREASHCVYDSLKNSISKDASFTTSDDSNIRKIERRMEKARRELFKKRSTKELEIEHWRKETLFETCVHKKGRPKKIEEDRESTFREKIRTLIEEHSAETGHQPADVLSNIVDHCNKEWNSSEGMLDL